MKQLWLNLLGYSLWFGMLGLVVCTVLASIAISELYSAWCGVPLLLLIPVYVAVAMTLIERVWDEQDAPR